MALENPSRGTGRRRGLVLRAVIAGGAYLALCACGSGWGDIVWGPSTDLRERPPSPTPSPSAPLEQPTPAAPAPSPSPEPNRAPVARVGARVYFIECQGQIVSGWDSPTAPVGCRVHMDCTPRDAADQPTEPQGSPYWEINDSTLIAGGARTSYTPAFTVLRAGSLRLSAVIDRVRSNTIAVELVP
jgi:hypothetical protein